ncbi:MAG: radical SAM family heme chaperone HemW [Candidatus Korobacteraceae bacterium]
MPLGIYISVPFCRTKCSFCNFASGVTSRAVYARYVDRVCEDVAAARATASQTSGRFEQSIDSIYLGGGTPTVLSPAELERMFTTVRAHFQLAADAEITAECAPGTLTSEMLESLLRCGVNRVSLGVQSFVDKESASVGRLHTRAIVLDDIARLRAAGIENVSIDLIAGLPHQTAESWRYSLEETIAIGVPHASVYILEVDEDSRLGKELIAGGTRYHAHHVPDDDATADFYAQACETLESAGIHQYEISNFAREAHGSNSNLNGSYPDPERSAGLDSSHGPGLPRYHSLHNLKYWTRQPYLGFGVDAHSMLPSIDPEFDAIRIATPDTLEAYMANNPPVITRITPDEAAEEACFLGLRLNRGVRFDDNTKISTLIDSSVLTELQQTGLLERNGGWLRLTPRGRLLSNEVFEQFIRTQAQPTQ